MCNCYWLGYDNLLRSLKYIKNNSFFLGVPFILLSFLLLPFFLLFLPFHAFRVELNRLIDDIFGEDDSAMILFDPGCDGLHLEV